jgi:predicted ribosomally synthesized peptide with nif11-like leader
MSKENLDQFIQQISDSEELQARIGEEIDADAFITLGAEHGCEFSAEDLTAGAELSDEELDGVAGGACVSYMTMRHGVSLRIRRMPQFQLDNKVDFAGLSNSEIAGLHNTEFF